MADLLQQARDIAADQYIRLQMKNPNSNHGAAYWGAHVQAYAGHLRSGSFDSNLEVQTALAALRSVAA